MAKTVIAKKAAQKNLMLVWAGATALLGLLFFGQTVVSDKYPGQNDDVWDWFLPFVVPTFMLMLGASVNSARGTTRQPSIDRFYYRLTLGAVAVYFATLLLVVLSAPLDFVQNATPAFDHLKKATKLLIALQSVVAAVLGWFFVKETPT